MSKICISCGKTELEEGSLSPICKECRVEALFGNPFSKNTPKHSSKVGESIAESVEDKMVDPTAGISFICRVLYALGFLEMAGGLVLCFLFWPDSPSFTRREALYIAPISFLFYGLVFGFLFFAAGKALSLLQAIWMKLIKS